MFLLLLIYYPEKNFFECLLFFSIWVFFHDHSRIIGRQGKEEGISLTPHYHFHPLHRHLDISRAITAESSPLHIGSSRTRTGNLWFPSASRGPLSYTNLLLKRKRKNVLNKFEQWLKRRTWLEEQVLLYIIWTDNARILNKSESAEICPSVGKYASISPTLWICLNMRETSRA